MGWWHADENAADASSTGNNGTYAGSFAAGKFGSAFSFSGGNYVSVPSNAAYNFSAGDYSVGFWFNLNGLSTGANLVFLGNDNGGGNTAKWFVDYNYGNAGVFNLHINNPSSGSVFLPSNAETLSNSQWYQLTVTKSGSLYSFYLDGTAIGTATSAVAFPNPTSPLTLGFAESGLGFDGGLLDEVVLYNRTLSSAEVAGLSAIPEPNSCALAAGLGALLLSVWGRSRRRPRVAGTPTFRAS